MDNDSDERDDRKFYKEWDENVLQWAIEAPPTRLPTSHHYNEAHRTSVFSHRQLRSNRTRKWIRKWYPDLRFDYSHMSEENIYDFWHVGAPMAIFPKYYHILVRRMASDKFDDVGRFVGNKKAVKKPPSLLLQVADIVRKEEYVRLRAEACISVQAKYGPFERYIDIEPEALLAHEILYESVTDFLNRMASSFISLQAAYKSMQ